MMGICFGNNLLSPAFCNQVDEAKLTSTELYHRLADTTAENYQSFVCDALVGIYNYLHCDSITKNVASALLQKDSAYHWPDRCPPPPSAVEGGAVFVGRRRRASSSITPDQVQRMIADAVGNTSEPCLQWLVECYKDTACISVAIDDSTSSAQCDNRRHPRNCRYIQNPPPSLDDLHQQLADASGYEHMQGYVCDVVIGLYNYLYDAHLTRDDARPYLADRQCYRDMDNSTCTRITTGRRRRSDNENKEPSLSWKEHPRASGDTENRSPVLPEGQASRPERIMFTEMLDNITRETGGDRSCLQWLLECYRGIACTNMSLPAAQHPSSHAATTTTPKPTTTTPAPGGRCTNCSGLECLRHQHVDYCPPDSGDLCYITVADRADGRHIDRGCASKSYCDGNIPKNEGYSCEYAEDKKLETGSLCYFCCIGENCNRPPLLIPEDGRYLPA